MISPEIIIWKYANIYTSSLNPFIIIIIFHFNLIKHISFGGNLYVIVMIHFLFLLAHLGALYIEKNLSWTECV